MTRSPCRVRPRRCAPATRRHQAGLTLLELVLSALLGLLVLSGVLLTFIGTGVSDRQQRALGRMTEDAQLAMTFITRELQMAGYQRIQSVAAPGANGTPRPVGGQSFTPVHGCNYGFVDNKAAFANSVCITPPPGTSPALTPAIEISHEVTGDNTLANSSNALTDCQGTAVAGGNWVSNRFFVVQGGSADDPVYELSCASNSSTPQPLVSQVRAVSFLYGIAPHWNDQDPLTWRPQRFIDAEAVEAAGHWPNVVAVRVCLLMRSADPVLGAGEPPAAAGASAASSAASAPNNASYIDCDGVRATSGDRHLYRAFKSTVTLRNRVS